jgi:arabinose-5-phosphate isomerase
MHTGEQIPMVLLGTSMKEAVLEMSSKRLGVTGVSDAAGRLVGIVTDGDLRRGLEKHHDLFGRSVEELMTADPKRIERTALAARAVALMEAHSITVLFVYEGEAPDTCVGVIHLHDLLKAGIA